MSDRQTKPEISIQNHSLLTSLSAHVFSTDYLYFVPAIVVSLLWDLLPIPKLATLCLFIWSLPLFTAGAVSALHKGPASLFCLIYNRCPVQGIFVLGYALAALAGFFIILLLANTLRWIGVTWRELLVALLMVTGTVTLLVRIWPDYLLRVIHPRNGWEDSWIGADFPYGLGPTVFTAWKYSARAKLPVLTIVSAIVSLFVVVGGVLFLHTSIFPNHEKFYLIGNIFILGLFYPIAHLVLVRAGCQLLSANSITTAPVAENTSHPSGSSLPASTTVKGTQFSDSSTAVDTRFFSCENHDIVEIIPGRLRQDNNINDLGKVTKNSPVYLVIVQDFMSLSNYGGFFTTVGIYEDSEKALNILYSQGQREPGLVVEVVASNSRMRAIRDEQGCSFPVAYEAFRFDWIVLKHAPTEFVPERFGIWEVFGANEQNELKLAEQTMKQQDIFSVAGRICEIADAEHGSYSGIEKIKGRSSIKGIQERDWQPPGWR
ncbi:MAG: hypothetical protein J7L25_09365 [Deltaproteobacteria bacterium]|nr:hypothetical protein [Candidatus Tharpella aukensis]